MDYSPKSNRSWVRGLDEIEMLCETLRAFGVIAHWTYFYNYLLYIFTCSKYNEFLGQGSLP